MRERLARRFGSRGDWRKVGTRVARARDSNGGHGQGLRRLRMTLIDFAKDARANAQFVL